MWGVGGGWVDQGRGSGLGMWIVLQRDERANISGMLFRDSSRLKTTGIARCENEDGEKKVDALKVRHRKRYQL